VEVEAFAITNLVAKIEENKLDAAPIWSDIKTFPAQIFSGKVHGIVGGYPCQPFSAAGKRKGRKDPRHLWPYIEQHIRTIRPVWCFFENVSGHFTLGFDEVFKSLRDLHYQVETGLFTASEVGFPHKRERLFILAYDNNRSCNSAIITKPIRQAQPESGNDSGERGSELADTEDKRFGRSKPEQDRWGQPRICSITGKNITGWPARPGQPQYEWEEPRTVKPGMGRTVDGFRSRVDELRLLGNGVVPAQAELAFRTLIEKI
jgi:DNA (cytosine-5)-methyltransferase 1